jgi:hypothetical protein
MIEDAGNTARALIDAGLEATGTSGFLGGATGVRGSRPIG